MKEGQGQVMATEMTTAQTLTPLQLMVVKSLELSDDGIEDWIDKEVVDNDALEKDSDNDSSDQDSADDNSDDYDAGEERKEKEEIVDSVMIDDDGNPLSKSSDTDGYVPEQKQEASDFDSLYEQIGEYKLSDKEQTILRYLIGSLDGYGLLQKPIGKILYELNVEQGMDASEDDVLDMLEVLQEFDPAGIGATSYAECLLIQAKRMEVRNQQDREVRDCMVRMFENYYDDFLHQRWSAMQQRLRVSDDVWLLIKKALKRLTPKPFCSETTYADHMTSVAKPTFIIKKDDEDVYFELCGTSFPRLVQSSDVKCEVEELEKNRKTLTKEGREWLSNRKKSLEKAQMFIDMIAQRQNTLKKTMKAIFDIQKDYFVSDDESKRKPMILEDVAKRTHLDISTISRVTNSRYVETLSGEILLLKSLFSAKYGDDKVKGEILNALKEIVDAEDKSKPFNDTRLSEEMKKKGFDVARRTISKYREELRIPDSRIRKNSNA